MLVKDLMKDLEKGNRVEEVLKNTIKKKEEIKWAGGLVTGLRQPPLPPDIFRQMLEARQQQMTAEQQQRAMGRPSSFFRPFGGV